MMLGFRECDWADPLWFIVFWAPLGSGVPAPDRVAESAGETGSDDVVCVGGPLAQAEEVALLEGTGAGDEEALLIEGGNDVGD